MMVLFGLLYLMDILYVTDICIQSRIAIVDESSGGIKNAPFFPSLPNNIQIHIRTFRPYPVGKIAKNNSLKKCVFINTLLQTAFSAILPTGYVLKANRK